MSLWPTPLASAHLALPQLARQPPAWHETLLGYASFSASGQTAHALAEIPAIHVHMPTLPPGSDSVCESWRSPAPLLAGRHGAVRFRHGDGLLFGCVRVDESAFTPRQDGATMQTPLRQAAAFAYREIFGLLDALDFPHLYRAWNYMADINGESHGIERYRQFNSGRQDGFLALRRTLTGGVPAACALGSMGGPLNVCFLAGREAPVAIENPRQLSAYHYPRQYGARAPTFSRANLIRLGEREVLFISGTASIVGHQSQHPGDAAAQTRETLENLAAVVEQANRLARASRFSLEQLDCKIYIRRPADAATIRQTLERHLGFPVQAVLLQADICRQDLLVEIEASGGHAKEPA